MTTAANPISTAQHEAQKKKSTRSQILFEIVKYSILIPLTISFAFPLYWMVSSALKIDPQIFTSPPVLVPIPIHPQNFIEAWQVMPFSLYTYNSLVLYVIPVTVLTVISSAIVAYGFARIQWRGREQFFWLAVMTMMLPWAVTMVPLFITFRNLGWLDTYLPFVVPAMFGHPYFIFLLRQFFLSIPQEISDAARIDGASEGRILFSIILPLSKAALAVVALFRFMWGWNDYLGPLIYLRSEELYPLALGIENLSRRANDIGNFSNGIPYLMAVSTIVALPIIVTFFFAQRTFIEGISLTGVKG
ncbi:MAG: carbohydrate ABC transporter permease [Chloroflexota bacterium]